MYPLESRHAPFGDFGVNVRVLRPGELNALYHAETGQEGFLVLWGECTLVVEDEERTLRVSTGRCGSPGRLDPTRTAEPFVACAAVKGSLAAAVVAALVFVLAGCGGSHDEPTPERTLTIPAYGPFPKQTYHVTPGTRAACRREAAAFGRAAEGFLRPFPSDADNYRVLAQVQFTAFKAHLCNTALLRDELSRRLTDKQVREVLSFFGFLRETARELLPGPQR